MVLNAIESMKLKALYILCCLLLIGFSDTSQIKAQEKNKLISKDENCITHNEVFGHGERVVYKVYYNWNFIWLSAGEVVFEVQETDKDFRIFATGKTYPSYEWFFKVRDYYTSYIDKETFLPHTFIREVQEGGYSIYDKVQFDQANQKGTSFNGKTKEEAKLQHFTFDNCMHDLLSIIYKMRNMEFETMDENSRIPVKIFLDMEEYPLDIRLLARNEKTWIKGLGYYKTFEISPQLIAGNVFNEGQKMSIWVSDDKNRVPLMIESPVSVGSVKVVLKEYKGLKHPFSSQIAP